jgi:vesicle coat complex subunit
LQASWSLRSGNAQSEYKEKWERMMTNMYRWGQIYILDSLLSFVPQTPLDAETLAERISVRLQHANSAVVLTTVKVVLYLMNYMEDEDLIRMLERKMGPPLGP